MVGVPQAFTGTAMPQLNIRGVIGGGVPWTLTKGKGSIRTDGHLKIKVDGLVLASTLSNPATTFRATVSCLTGTGDTMNVQTGTFPATTGLASEGGGDSTIEARSGNTEAVHRPDRLRDQRDRLVVRRHRRLIRTA